MSRALLSPRSYLVLAMPIRVCAIDPMFFFTTQPIPVWQQEGGSLTCNLNFSSGNVRVSSLGEGFRERLKPKMGSLLRRLQPARENKVLRISLPLPIRQYVHVFHYSNMPICPCISLLLPICQYVYVFVCSTVCIFFVNIRYVRTFHLLRHEECNLFLET